MRIVIPQLAPGLNGSNGLMRMHFQQYREVRDAWTWEIKALANGTLERAAVRIDRFYARSGMDVDNLYSTAKIPLDALRHAGVIPDDDPESIVSLTVRQHKVDTVKEERTEIVLTPVDAKGQRIIEAVCEYYGIENEDLRARRKDHRKLTRARKMAMYLLMESTLLEPEKIGRLLNRHRSSIYYGLQQIRGELDVYEDTRKEVAAIEALISTDVAAQVESVVGM